ncbi:MAG: non-canonical purine NTP diphosphatase [Bacteroidales bacterium]
MLKIVFASHNKHKKQEVAEILGDSIELIDLEELNCTEEIPETQDSLQGNALQKARFVREKYGMDCFADDTGLEVEALNGAPGVYSARYAGPACNFDDNMDKLLLKLQNEDNRKARFRTVVALLLDGREYLFEGEVKGEILRQKAGSKGFGYDPLFRPENYELSFAQLEPEQKNQISHRAAAVQKMALFLEAYKKR